MSNQAILWAMLILPWLTLFFMKPENIRRFAPVALFTVATSMLLSETAGTLELWVVRENIFPLSSTLPLILSVNPVVTLWLFNFTYGRLWRYIAVDAVMNLVFALIVFPWLDTRGIYQDNVTGQSRLFFTTIHGLLLYAFQMWQEGALVPAVKKLLAPKIQPAAVKPYFKKDNDDN